MRLGNSAHQGQLSTQRSIWQWHVGHADQLALAFWVERSLPLLPSSCMLCHCSVCWTEAVKSPLSGLLSAADLPLLRWAPCNIVTRWPTPAVNARPWQPLCTFVQLKPSSGVCRDPWQPLLADQQLRAQHQLQACSAPSGTPGPHTTGSTADLHYTIAMSTMLLLSKHCKSLNQISPMQFSRSQVEGVQQPLATSQAQHVGTEPRLPRPLWPPSASVRALSAQLL